MRDTMQGSMLGLWMAHCLCGKWVCSGKIRALWLVGSILCLPSHVLKTSLRRWEGVREHPSVTVFRQIFKHLAFNSLQTLLNRVIG